MGILRFILAITVVLTHSSSIFGINFVGGRIAVQAFYIISGFYMALILNEKYIKENDSYKLFITNRFLRLFPIYWVILLLTVLYSWTISGYTNGNVFAFGYYIEYMHTMKISSFIFLLFTNLFLFLQDTIMFLGLDTSTGHLFFSSNFMETNPMLYKFLFIPQAWTIGVELLFYLIVPFLARKKLKFIILLVALSLLLRWFLYQNGFKNDPWSHRFFPTELLFFLLGIISYHIYVKLRAMEIKTFYLKFIFGGMLSFTLFFNFISIPVKYPLYLFLFFICLPFIFLLTKKWKNDNYIGELSYPIYISHMFLLMCISPLNIPESSSLGISMVVITVIFAILLNELVVKKIEKIRQKRITPNC